MEQADWLAAVLRGECIDWPFGWGPRDCESVLLAAQAQGVSGMLLPRLDRYADPASLPAALRPALRRRVRGEAAAEFSRQIECERVLGLLAGAGLSALLMKGTALAYSLYPEPHWRSRCDTDLLFADRDAASLALEVFARDGYRPIPALGGTVLNHEVCCFKQDRFGVTHSMDLHWAANNLPVFADLLPFAELAAAAALLPRLGPHALGVAPVHGLLLACMHRLQHAPEGQSNRLIWLYDIHLLTAGFSAADWSAFSRLAMTRGVSGVCLAGLMAARRVFRSTLPPGILEALTQAAAAEWLTPARFATLRGQLIANLLALDDWGSRRRLVREHLFPDAAYLTQTYGARQGWRLPLLYLRWIGSKIGKALR